MPHNVDRIQSDGPYINRRQWLSMLGVGGAAALAGCTGGGDDDEDPGAENGGDDDAGVDPDAEIPDVSGQYDDVQASGFDTLNPITNTEDGAGTAIGYALDMGYTFNPDNELVPLLYDVTTDDGGETWTIDIREGLEFSDPYGEFTADDFVFYVEEIHQAEWAPSANSPDWEGVEVEEVGDYEVECTLENPNLLWPETFNPLEYPIPRDLIEPYVEDEDAEGLQEDTELIELEFTGNMGAFTLDEWVRDGGTSYTRNDEYYLRDVAEEDDDYRLFAEAPYFETLELQIIEEESSRISSLETGAVDHVTLPPDRGEQFMDDDDTRVVLADTPFNNILSVNQRDNGWTAGPGNLFQVKEFRQALAAAIDKPQLIEGVYRGFHDEHYTWQPEFSEWFPGTDELTLWGHPEDGVYGDEARDLAEQALDQIDEDYTYDGDTLLTPDGDQVELQLYYNAASETQELAAGFFEQEFEEHLGFTLELNSIDGTRFSEEYWDGSDIAEPGTTVEHDGREFTWDAPNPSNPGPREYTSNEAWDFGTIFGLNTYPRNPLTNDAFFDGPGNFYNPVGYYPEFDAEGLFDEARSAEDRDELQEVFNELFVNLNEEQPYIMLTFGVDIEGYNPDLVGPIGDFANGYDFPTWYFDE
ncbi:ABC transporter substrate-binding protein [Natranaeroarchaeum sulfidigenes]|uniref:ABC transporter substrate-binding protein n=1 Tax=Natranaeroarchaeum sulfidigenes TaxID=2784880 RepID=UPI001EE4F9CC|nr:ABC transporter substrate-binding protein [Natranaeroarchaeum sulfidigenes]